MTTDRPKSLLDRFLNLFTEVRAGEGLSAVLLMINIFIILTSYYIIKPVREAFILAGGGAELKSYISAGQVILLAGLVPLYGRLAGNFNRRKLINVVTIFFAACLALFYVLAQTKVPVGIIFYLWVGIFNVMVIAQFWAFANDLYTPEAGKRIFPLIGFGMTSGAVMGSIITGLLIKPLGIYQLLLISGALLLLSLILTNLVEAKQKKADDASTANVIEKSIGKANAFALVFRNRYLLMIAFLILILNWVNTNGEYILGKIISAAARDAVESGTAGGMDIKQHIGMFYSQFFGVVNVATMLIQLFIVSRILKYMGFQIAMLILPIIALCGYLAIAFFPILAIVRWTKTAENSTDYSLMNTLRQVMFLPTTREQKYKAKQAIDSFFMRAGDVLSAGLVFAGTTWLALHTKHFALVNLILVIVWLILAILIGRENRRMTESESIQR